MRSWECQNKFAGVLLTLHLFLKPKPGLQRKKNGVAYNAINNAVEELLVLKTINSLLLIETI